MKCIEKVKPPCPFDALPDDLFCRFHQPPGRFVLSAHSSRSIVIESIRHAAGDIGIDTGRTLRFARISSDEDVKTLGAVIAFDPEVGLARIGYTIDPEHAFGSITADSTVNDITKAVLDNAVSKEMMAE